MKSIFLKRLAVIISILTSFSFMSFGRNAEWHRILNASLKAKYAAMRNARMPKTPPVHKDKVPVVSSEPVQDEVINPEQQRDQQERQQPAERNKRPFAEHRRQQGASVQSRPQSVPRTTHAVSCQTEAPSTFHVPHEQAFVERGQSLVPLMPRTSTFHVPHEQAPVQRVQSGLQLVPRATNTVLPQRVVPTTSHATREQAPVQIPQEFDLNFSDMPDHELLENIALFQLDLADRAMILEGMQAEQNRRNQLSAQPKHSETSGLRRRRISQQSGSSAETHEQTASIDSSAQHPAAAHIANNLQQFEQELADHIPAEGELENRLYMINTFHERTDSQQFDRLRLAYLVLTDFYNRLRSINDRHDISQCIGLIQLYRSISENINAFVREEEVFAGEYIGQQLASAVISSRVHDSAFGVHEDEARAQAFFTEW